VLEKKGRQAIVSGDVIDLALALVLEVGGQKVVNDNRISSNHSANTVI